MRFEQVVMAASQGGGFAYDADAALYFAAVVTAGGTVSATRKGYINTFILAEKAAGTWALTDDYWMLAAESATQGLVSLKQLRTATATSTFAADGGYTSDGATTFVSTGFIPTTHAVVMSAATCRIATYARTNTADAVAGNSAGCRGATATNALWLVPRSSTDTIFGRAVSATGTSATAVTDSRGFTAISRANTTSIPFYKNGSALAAATSSAGAALPEVAIYIGAQNNNGTAAQFCTGQIAFACVSASLSAAQELAQYNNVQAHMTAIGANV